MTLKSPKPPRKPLTETVIPVGEVVYYPPKRQPPRRPGKKEVRRGNAFLAPR